MIIFGAPNVVLPIIQGRNDFIVYNLSANIVNPSIPTLNLQYLKGLDFTNKDYDNIFANMVFENDSIFIEFMKLILPLRDGYNVAILIYREENLFDPFSETIAKLIQQRYGYNYQMINTMDDYNEWDDSNFDINGTFLLDRDSDRYIQIMARINPKSFIDEKIDDRHL